MRRIVIYSVRALVVIIAIIAIVWLVRQTIDSVNELKASLANKSLYSEHSASFPQAATGIQQDYTQVIYRETHAPTSTQTPTEASVNPNDSGSSDQVTLTPTTGDTTAPDTAQAPTAGTAVNTAAPSVTPWTPVVPTQVSLAATLPPTNTKRPSPTPVNATSTPTPIPPTDTPTATLTATPTTAATATPVTPSAVAPTSVTSAPVASLAPTDKLPTVLLPAQRTEKPQVTAIPTNAPRVKANGNDILNILIIGTDHDIDPSDPSFNTDTMIVVSINRTTNTVAMLSIPRDLFVYIPTLGMQRINTAYHWGEAINWSPGGGFGLLQATILYNLGIPVHYYAKVSFDGYKQIIDSLGGIDLAVDCPISDLRFLGKVDDKKTPVYEPFKLDPGYYHMDGSFSLWYARMRHSTSDFDRNRRQQQILRAMWRTARDQGLIAEAPQLWSHMTSVVETNMPVQDALALVPLALSIKPTDITGYYMFKGIETKPWTTPAGENIQLPDPQGFFRTINNFYTPPTANRLGAQAPIVEVVNSSGNKDWDKVAADHLTWDGFDVQDKGAADMVAKTTVYDLTGSAKPGPLQALMKSVNVRSEQVVSQPDPNRTADFRVVLGSDYNSCTAPGFSK